MAELEIDQSNLPRVQEVEQYYTTNIQKNQLVQNDIRVAKRLQDEEEDQRAQQSADLRQASRQLEEQDLEYARVIQEELQRCAEEAHRREQDDEEIAKRMQDEEEQRIRARSRGQEGHSEDSTSDSALPASRQHTLSSQGGEQCSSFTTRWQYSTNHSDLTGTGAASHRGPEARESTTSGSNQGHTGSIRPIREELREALSEDSEESDTVFSAQLSDWSQRPNRRLSTAPPQHRAASRYPQERNYRSLNSRSSFRGWTEERGEGDYYDNESYDREKRRHGSRQQERSPREDYEPWHRSGDQDRDSGSVEGRERRCSRSESVRLPDRSRHLARTWSQRDNPDRRVHFQEDTSHSDRQPDESGQVWEMLGQVLRERGVAVTVGAHGVPLQIGPQSRDSQVLHGSEVSCCSSRPHQRDFQRAATTRHSFHGDIRKRRISSHRENSGRDHREEPDGRCDTGERGGEVYEISSRESNLASGEIRGSRRWSEHRNTSDEARGRNANESRVKRSTSERRPRHKTTERRLSSEEVRGVEGRAEWPPRRAPQRSLSLSSTGASSMDRSRHEAEGVSLQPDPSETSLNLGELQQVLRDEELARKLQDEEDKLLRRISDPRSSQPPPRGPYPQGDFRVAQVAQDEEIARFMQKQEIKSKRRSQELEGPGSWREHRAMISHHDRRTARERQVQRERLDSEGLPSPTEDCCPENQPPSPSSTLLPAQQIRNIAEELDPTFQARRQDTERLPVEQTGPACQTLPVPHSGLNGFLVEPAFIPPTKRQPEKSTHSKPKEKKENCKQQ
ncbi:coiled-coil domain-containing protein 187 isoform X2 [Platichthys flesus]|uniref:coiled-coil domain-containing protein 187 isoform X2 n=1 Tax=Platichthys flesus TaxID=8260 RepID=UPI002DBC143F|nr:coiled-coil domain-containing protein 187 isoform X2 [Platichthys flesus]